MIEVREGYKMTEIGEIPNEWESMNIGDVFKFQGGSQPPRDTFVFEEREGYIRLIQIRDYKTDKYKTFIPIELAKRFCTKEDIMIGRYGPPIFQILRGIEGSYNVALIKAIPNEKLDKEYGYYYLTTEPLFKLIDKLSQRTSGQTGIDMDALKSYPLPLPPLEEQQKIASIFSTLDQKINETEQLIVKTKELKKGLMQQLLKKGIGHTQFKQTELGEIPDNWEYKTLEKVCYFSNGKAHEEYVDENGEYILINSKFISTEGRIAKNASAMLMPLEVNDITIVMSDVPKGKAFAKCFLVSENNKYTLNQRIGLIRTDSMYPEFLFYQLNRNSYFLSFDNGVGQTNLRKSDLLACPILVPPLEEQQEIALILSTVDEQVVTYEEEKANYEELKKGLMQQLLTGQIRVKI